MRCRLSKTPLPRWWVNDGPAVGVLAEADISPLPRGRLRMKLLVFTGGGALRRFWADVVGHTLCRGTVGVVNDLVQDVTSYRTGLPVNFKRADPTYFAVMGLTRNNLTMEVVGHESVHAGFAYARRVGGRNTFGHPHPATPAMFAEEQTAYPTGAITMAVTDFLYRRRFFPVVKTQRIVHIAEKRGTLRLTPSGSGSKVWT